MRRCSSHEMPKARFLNNMLQSPIEKIQDHIKCGICLDNVSIPYLCPRCSKMFCKGCIEKCLEVNNKCPHCRFTVRNQKQFIRCYWVDQLSNDLENLDQSLCPTHKEKLSLYCNDCTSSLCSHCALFESDHENHEISSIKDMCAHYHSKIENLKQNIGQYQTRLHSSHNDLQNNLNLCQHEREMIFKSVCSAFEQCSKLILSFQKSQISQEMENIETQLEVFHHALSELDNELELANPIRFIEKAESVIENIEKVIFTSSQNPLLSEDKLKIQDPQVYSECMNFAPDYDVKIMKLFDFSHLSANDKLLCSQPIVYNNMEFKLEVHTSGLVSDPAKYRSVISMFIVLSSSSSVQSNLNFSVKVDVVNQHGSKHLDKSCNFLLQVPPYIHAMSVPVPLSVKLDSLDNYGYLIPDIDCLVLRFGLRPVSFETQAQIQADYIQQLENKLNIINQTVKDSSIMSRLSTVVVTNQEDPQCSLYSERNQNSEPQTSKFSRLVQNFSSMWPY